VLVDVAKAGAPPRADRRLVPQVRVDGDAPPAALVAQVARDRTGGVRAEPAPARGRHEEHVDPARSSIRPRLQVAHGLAVRLDNERVDLRAAQAREHLRACEALVIPVPRDLRIVVPADEQVGVALFRRPNHGRCTADAQTCQVSSTAERNRFGAFSQ
jgi:hypothetical protein